MDYEEKKRRHVVEVMASRARQREQLGDNAPDRLWRRANKERLNANARAMGERQLAWFRSLKTSPCVDCGGSFPPVCMDFDHRPGEVKVADVSVLARGPKARVLAEIAKCDLVCANCHRIRTERIHEAKRTATRAKYVKPAPRWARSLSSDQQREVCGRYEHGESQASIARRFDVSGSVVYGVLIREGLRHCPPSWQDGR